MTENTPHPHDLGLAHDLPRLLSRRRVLSSLGAMTALASPALAGGYVALPWETAGPYPGDGTNAARGQIINVLTQEGVIRRDLRQSFAGVNSVAEGVALDLELTLVDVADGAPLAGHVLYLWHCDTVGRYSIYDLPQDNFLRGVGIADGAGQVRFTTIFPGCYAGRWPHMHFEVFAGIEDAVSGQQSVLTAQIALPQEVCAQVYDGDARYRNGARNLSRTSLTRDNVFRDNTDAQIAQQTLAMTGDPAGGYAGRVTVPVDLQATRPERGLRPPPPQD